MFFAGCDVGSLTAKGVILDGEKIIASKIIRVKETPEKSAKEVMDLTFKSISLSIDDIEKICSTGYGRNEISFAHMNMSEISCHGMGAFFSDNSIRTIIDIGGQDCKVISIDEQGYVLDFIMNDKCAAGTGRSLEIVADTMGVQLEDLGKLSLKSRKPLEINNKCSIFMELEVLDALYSKKKNKDIANGLSDAVAKRVVNLSSRMKIKKNVCLTGGVSKNQGVVKRLEHNLGLRLTKINTDPQAIGALGAAIFAKRLSERESNK